MSKANLSNDIDTLLDQYFKDLSGVNLAEDFWNNLEKLK